MEIKDSCYIVKNISKNTVTLTDLRAIIRPGETLDLEKVARRIDIERSVDLITAIKMKILKIIRKISPNKISVQKQSTDEELAALIRENTRKAIRENEARDPSKLQETIKRQIDHSLNKQFDEKLSKILDAINSIGTVATSNTTNNTTNDPTVDLDKLAEITQKGVNSISSKVDTSANKPVKKIKINTNINEIAKDLE